jgi:hypothetical protein
VNRIGVPTRTIHKYCIPKGEASRPTPPPKQAVLPLATAPQPFQTTPTVLSYLAQMQCSVKIFLHRSRKAWLGFSSCDALGDQVDRWFPAADSHKVSS